MKRGNNMESSTMMVVFTLILGSAKGEVAPVAPSHGAASSDKWDVRSSSTYSGDGLDENVSNDGAVPWFVWLLLLIFIMFLMFMVVMRFLRDGEAKEEQQLCYLCYSRMPLSQWQLHRWVLFRAKIFIFVLLLLQLYLGCGLTLTLRLYCSICIFLMSPILFIQRTRARCHDLICRPKGLF